MAILGSVWQVNRNILRLIDLVTATSCVYKSYALVTGLNWKESVLRNSIKTYPGSLAAFAT
jgi:hypothetical protein